jgi:hypothetical protein
MDWSVNTIQFLALKEVHDIFKAGETHTSKCTDKKENQIFLIYKEIQSGAVAKSYMTNDLLIYGENICAFPHILGSPSSYMTSHPIPSEFPYI